MAEKSQKKVVRGPATKASASKTVAAKKAPQQKVSASSKASTKSKAKAVNGKAVKTKTVKTKTVKAKTVRAKSSKTASPNLQLTLSSLDQMSGMVGVPKVFQTLAENTLVRTQTAYETAKDAVVDATEAFEDAIDQASESATKLNAKVIDMTQANIDNSFGLAKDLAGAKNLVEAAEVQTTYIRKQFEQLSDQAQQFSKLSSKVATDTTQSFTSQITRPFGRLRLGD